MAMNKRIHFVYDDRRPVPAAIAGIVGERRFGSIVRNRRTLAEWVADCARAAGIEVLTTLSDEGDLETLREASLLGSRATCFVHFVSRGAVVDREGMEILLRKIGLAEGTLLSAPVDPIVAGFHDASNYDTYLSLRGRGVDVSAQDFEPAAQVVQPAEVVVDLSDVSTFLAFFSGGFETRHFNLIKSDELTVLKRSADKRKIESEYRFYGLLPEHLQQWFVQPYGLRSDAEAAAYEMERLGVADMAIIWIHGAITGEEFEVFLRKLFRFVDSRPSRPVPMQQFVATRRQLYLDKVRERVQELCQARQFARLDAHVRAGTRFDGVLAVADAYAELFERYLRSRGGDEPRAVIGHGDLCFSNILYDKATRLMKFVDPKGAMSEEELWSDPLYDLAKLSHSIFGGYDFLNNNLFAVEVDESLDLTLSLRGPEVSDRQAAFQRHLEDRGLDLYAVRLCEASLFLSMLPLHGDDPQKVLAFVLNAIHILEELERNV